MRILKDLHDDVGVDEISSLGVAPRRLARVIHGHRALSLRAVHLLPLRRRHAVAQRPGEVVPRQVRPPRVLVLILRRNLQDVPAGRDQERDAHDLIRREARVEADVLRLGKLSLGVDRITRLGLGLGLDLGLGFRVRV